jgi:septal ring factor EnvC (AmiA/AmiB activator)
MVKILIQTASLLGALAAPHFAFAQAASLPATTSVTLAQAPLSATAAAELQNRVNQLLEQVQQRSHDLDQRQSALQEQERRLAERESTLAERERQLDERAQVLATQVPLAAPPPPNTGIASPESNSPAGPNTQSLTSPAPYREPDNFNPGLDSQTFQPGPTPNFSAGPQDTRNNFISP